MSDPALLLLFSQMPHCTISFRQIILSACHSIELLVEKKRSSMYSLIVNEDYRFRYFYYHSTMSMPAFQIKKSLLPGSSMIDHNGVDMC